MLIHAGPRIYSLSSHFLTWYRAGAHPFVDNQSVGTLDAEAYLAPRLELHLSCKFSNN